MHASQNNGPILVGFTVLLSVYAFAVK